MTTIAGVRIAPGFFKQRRESERPRPGASVAPDRVKPTVVHKPSAPRAKYAMPVIAIVGAIATFAGGAAIATVAGATMGAMIVGGAMMVGAAMVIVGTVTDRPNLVKWGGILALAGGIGAGVLGAMGGLTEAASVAGSAPTGYVDAIGNVAEGASAGAPLSGAVVPGVGAPSAVASLPAAPPPATGILATGAEAAPAAPLPPAAAPQPFTQAATEVLAPQGGSPFVTAGPVSVPAFAPATPPPSGFLGGAAEWIRNNPELARGGFAGATGLLSSAVPKPLTDLERAQAEEARLRAARMNPSSAWWRQPARGG